MTRELGSISAHIFTILEYSRRRNETLKLTPHVQHSDLATKAPRAAYVELAVSVQLNALDCTILWQWWNSPSLCAIAAGTGGLLCELDTSIILACLVSVGKT